MSAEQLLPAEVVHAQELRFLSAWDDGARPPGWRLTPRAAVTFVGGSADEHLSLPRRARAADYVRAADARGIPKPDASSDAQFVDPLDPFKRRLQQVLLGGTSALSDSTASGFAHDEAVLARNHLPTAVQLLRKLRQAPFDESDATTRRERLAQAWLAGRTYAAAAEARLQRHGWLD